MRRMEDRVSSSAPAIPYETLLDTLRSATSRNPAPTMSPRPAVVLRNSLQPPDSPAASQPRSQPLFRPRKHDDGTSGN